MAEVLMLTLSVAELETIRTLLLFAESARLLTHQLHEGSVFLGTVARLLPPCTVSESVTASADVARFGTVRSHISVVVLTFASVGPLLASIVFVNTSLVTTIISIVLWNKVVTFILGVE